MLKFFRKWARLARYVAFTHWYLRDPQNREFVRHVLTTSPHLFNARYTGEPDKPETHRNPDYFCMLVYFNQEIDRRVLMTTGQVRRIMESAA